MQIDRSVALEGPMLFVAERMPNTQKERECVLRSAELVVPAILSKQVPRPAWWFIL